jgi:hypothetical protein
MVLRGVVVSAVGLFVVRNPYTDRARLTDELYALAHEKLALELRLSTITERLDEIMSELENIERRLAAQG